MRILVSALTLLVLSTAAFSIPARGQAPVELLKVDPHSHTRCSMVAALSGAEPDPWYTCLAISYKNASTQPITGIRFDVHFVSALEEVDPTTVSYESTQSLKPGKSFTTMWHDGVYWHQYGDRMGARVTVARVMFADGSIWTPPPPASAKVEPPADDVESARALLVKVINSTFVRDHAVGYAEISGDKLIVHSERASPMRFRMILANETELSLMKNAKISLFVYSNDATQTFTYDLKAGTVVDSNASASASAPR